MPRIWLLLIVLIGCSPSITHAPPIDDGPHDRPPIMHQSLQGQVQRLVIKNACSMDIWVQQTGMSGAAVVQVKPGLSTSYNIPAEGLASTRYWPKQGCDVTGQNCKVGQSSPPCPAIGCAPPVDSKLEATWGCTLPDKSKCGKTPQGVRMIDTFWNSSGVDGYTFPFTIKVSGGDGRAACKPVDCGALMLDACPTDNLSNGGANPAYSKQDLKLSGGGIGCYSPCMKLNYPGFGGDGLNAPAGPVEQMYCCPTPPISSPQCQAGPVPKTNYVGLVHKACNNTSYGYAYDDGLGGRVCSGDTVLEMTVGPKCPLEILK
jgi:hypothetical protein